jgi:DNA adenine methylase
MTYPLESSVRPILKWAGGKSQMLKHILPCIPKYEGKYIEPFFGGGALFFALQPKQAVISDSNPELINVYNQVAKAVDQVIVKLRAYQNTEEMFYRVRAIDWTELSPVDAAARTIYLNKTCYNGLYRVNRKGQFNTPYGRYKNPTICDESLLRTVSKTLKNTMIICGDYLDVLHKYAMHGDLVFLDPPYVPISEYADFKRYTKEQFYTDDHKALAVEVERLRKIGCNVILTNSNHPLVHQLYNNYDIKIFETKRAVSSKGSTRRGEDVIVTAFPDKSLLTHTERTLPEQVELYPPTRFMGSKSKLLSEIWSVASNFKFESVLDLFSGSGIVGYMFKSQGKRVISNDYMAMSAIFAKAMIENNKTTLSIDEAKQLLIEKKPSDHFVENTFKGLYFADKENQLIDTLRTNIWSLDNKYKQAIAMTALIRACMKKRPRGIFTYTGERYNDGRRDLMISMEQQFLEAVGAVNLAIFDNEKDNLSIQGDAMSVPEDYPDLVYLDPPYYTPLSDNEYVRRYHFVEGLARDWKGVEIQEHTKTKKFKSYPTPFSTKNGAAEAFDKLFQKYRNSILIVSYSSNSIPTQEEMIALIKQYKEHVEVVPIDYTYSFGNQKTAKTHRNSVQEFLFVGF